MPTIKRNFTVTDPIGETTDLLYLRRNEKLRCIVTGVFNAKIALEYTHNGGLTWVEQTVVDSTIDHVINAITSASEKALYRMRLVEFNFGIVNVTIEDVSDDIPDAVVKDNKGEPLLISKDGLILVEGDLQLDNLIVGGNIITPDSIYIGPESELPPGLIPPGSITLTTSLASMKYDSASNVFTFDKGLVIEGINNKAGQQIKTTIVTDPTYNIVKTDFAIFYDTSLNDIVSLLPEIEAGEADEGRVFRVQKSTDNSNSLTFKSQSPSKINSEDTDIVMGIRNDNGTFVASGGNWLLLNRDTAALGAIELATPGATQTLNGTPTRLSVHDTNRFSTPGVCEADHVNDVINIAHVESVSMGGDGYHLSFRFEITGYSNNKEIDAQIFVKGVATKIKDVQTTSVLLNTVLQANGVYQVPGSLEDVEVKIFSSNTELATFVLAQLVAERLVR